MVDDHHDRELGEVRVEIKHMQKDISEIKKTQQEMRDTLVGAKGSWKVLTVAATLIMSTVSVILSKVYTKLFGGW